LFVLGRDPLIAKLELISVLTHNGIKFEIIDRTDQILVIEAEINPLTLIKQLAGTLKIAEQFNIQDLSYSKRIRYAVNDYGATENFLQELKQEFKRLKVKAMLKKSKFKAQLTPKETLKLLKDDGLDFVVFKQYLGKTVACSNPESYATRDVSRPMQRFEQMISIRLARMMVNIVAKPNAVVLDPFCGYGVLLQEAMLLGHDVIGVDKDDKCVTATKKNLAWIKKKYKLKAKFDVIEGDCSELSSIIGRVDSIATEPVLGPVFKTKPSRKDALKIVAKLKPFYEKVLLEFNKVVKYRVAILMPRFEFKHNIVRIDLSNILTKTRFKIVHEPIIYATPKSKIKRELWVFQTG